MKYTLYHIKGKKWGCTQNLKRRLKDQKLSLSDVCEIIYVDNIDDAARLEEELNKKHGYKWKTSENYKNVMMVLSKAKRKGFTEEERIRGGKKSGQLASERGQIQSIASSGGKVGGKTAGKIQSQKEYTCNVCGQFGRGNRMVSHIKKCNKL